MEKRNFLTFLFLFWTQLTVAAPLENLCSLSEVPPQFDRLDNISLKSLQKEMPTSFGVFRYEIHVPENRLYWVPLIESIVEVEGRKVIEYFQHVPDHRVHFILDHRAESANGSATVFPTNTIFLFDYPPQGREHLAFSRDWPKVLVVHELAHIITLERIRGVMGGISYVFGTFVNLIQSLTPRWYAEGLAVWAETEFTSEGRLRNQALLAELQAKHSQNDFCKNIGCLDSPGKYPYGQYPYWEGAAFLSYLEKKKPGTLQCMIHRNAKAGPFSLESAFSDCTGKGSEDLYQEYLSKTVKNAVPTQEISRNWQKGIAFFPGGHYQVVNHKQKDYVRRILDSGAEGGRFLFNGYADGFSQGVWDVDLKKFRDPEHIYLNYQDYSRKNRWLCIDNTVAADIGQRGELPLSGEHLFSLGDGQYVFLRFEEGSYSVYSQKLSASCGEKVGDEKLLLRLPFGVVENPHWWIRKGVHTLSFTTLKKTKSDQALGELLSYSFNEDLSFQRITTLGTLKASEKWKGLCLQKNNPVFLTWDYESEELKAITPEGTTYSQNLAKAMPVDVYTSPNGIYFQQKTNQLVKYQGSCEDLSTNPTGAKLTHEERPLESSPVVSEGPLHNYPQIHHFRPYYWGFSYTGARNLSTFTAITSLSDPYLKNNFTLIANYYTQLGKVTPEIGYTYLFGTNTLSLTGGKNLAQASLSNKIWSTTYKSMAFDKAFPLPRMSYVAGLNVKNVATEDFLSRREYYRFGLNQYLFYRALQQGVFVQGMDLSFHPYRQETMKDESFWGFDTAFRSSFQPHYDHLLYASVGFGRSYNKSRLSNTLFGGGPNSLLGNQTIYELLGVGFGDLYGRRILTSRLRYEYIFARPFTGGGMAPFLRKTWSTLAGLEYGEAERVFLKNGLYRDQGVTTWHAGLRLNADVFYALPLKIDLLAFGVITPRFAKNLDGMILFSLGPSF